MIISDVDIEKRNRIRVAVAAYAYEYKNDPIMSDGEFDSLCLKIRPEIETGHYILDNFFKQIFDKSTGMWVRQHPDINGLHNIYIRVYKNKPE